MRPGPSFKGARFSEKREANQIGRYTLELEFFEMKSRTARL